jgi:hypothetical protein
MNTARKNSAHTSNCAERTESDRAAQQIGFALAWKWVNSNNRTPRGLFTSN